MENFRNKDLGKQFLGRFNSLQQAVETKDGWGGHGGYMKAKNSKLNQQNQETYAKRSSIFNGISIWVDGYTTPSSDELKRMTIEHGGQFQHFFSKTHVTHVIATNLPDSKIKALKKNDKVVRPGWIVDSIKSNELLSIDKYLLYSANKRDGTTLPFETLKKTVNEKEICKHKDVSFKEDSSDQAGLITIPSSAESMDDTGESVGIYENPAVPALSKHSYSPPKETAATASSIKPTKAGDDNFIAEFYSHSRLHHLSMWKSELKKFAVSIQQKNKNGQSKSVSNNNINNKNKLIMHIDLDSFFVSVSLKLNPELKGKPIAVCHSGRNGQEGKTYENSYSEIASCSYEAREFGLQNGMFLMAAKQLCPSLICVPYQFEEYRNVSQRFYEILSTYTSEIEAVSCDEALLDITDLVSMEEDIPALAEKIRADIWNKTGCIASCGIGNSILVARLATKRAKPDGVCLVTPKEISQFIENYNIEDLPGVGRAHKKNFQLHNIKTCKDLQVWSLSRLQKEFGLKHGEMLYNFCRGKDERKLKLDEERKSVSAEINYGMRFTKMEEVEKFVRELSEEVERRLKEICKKGCQISLKLMTRRTDSEPAKFHGHGICDKLSRSVTLPSPTDDKTVIAKSVLGVLRAMHQLQPPDIRGMGIQITKIYDATAESTKTLLQFTKVLTPQELHKRDEMMKENKLSKTTNQNKGPPNLTNRINSPLKLTNQDKLTTSKASSRLQTITSFLEPCQTLNKFDELPPKELPPLPNIVLDDATSGNASSSDVSRIKHTNVVKDGFNDWDSDVFSELPKDIQLELSEMKAQHLARPSTVLKVGKSPSEKNISLVKIPLRLMAARNSIKSTKRGRPRKLDQQYISPSLNNRDTLFNIASSVGIPATTSTTRPRRTATKSKDLGFISPAQVNFDVVRELPEDIRNEILKDFKKSGCYMREKSKKLILEKPTIPISRKKNEHLSSHDYQTLNNVHHNKELDEGTNKAVSSSTIISLTQLDQSFLRALPEDMRIEIIEDAKRRRIESSVPAEGQKLSVSNTARNKKELLPAQFNKSVLNALPESIRDEILNDQNIGSGQQPQTKQQKNNPTFILDTCDEEEKKGTDSLESRELKQVSPELRGVSGCREVRMLIRSWMVEFPNEPLDEDIEEICQYFQRLISSYNLETLFVLLKFMRRFIAEIPTWHEPFNGILKCVQKEMIKNYGGSLPIDSLG